MSTVTFGCDDFAPHDTSKSARLPLLRRVLKNIVGLFCAVRHRTEMRQLMSSDPRLLEDIGITQSDVMSAMSRSIFTDPTQDIGARIDRRHAAWRKHTGQSN